MNVAARPVGTPAASITSLAKALEPSKRAPAGSGTEHGEAPVAQLIGQSGHQRRLRAHHGEVDLLALHEGDEAGMSSAPMATVTASSSMPGLPGAPISRPIRALFARARTSACSRAPPPTTRTSSRSEAMLPPLADACV